MWYFTFPIAVLVLVAFFANFTPNSLRQPTLLLFPLILKDRKTHLAKFNIEFDVGFNL